MIDELFIPVASLENRYAVSEKGRVRNIKTGKPVKGSLGKPGYRVVHYKSPDKGLVQRYIHHLVLEAFAKGVTTPFVTNHKDGDKLNNSVDNLEKVSPRENAIHANKTGLCQRSDQRPNVKVLDKDIPTIKGLRSTGLTYAEIASMYGVSRHLVSYICRGTRRSGEE